MDPFYIKDILCRSRLLLGSSGYPSPAVFQQALQAAGAEIVTVAIRRLPSHQILQEAIYRDLHHLRILPNTSGCYTARDAILTAQLAREALGTEWIKLEVIGDDLTLYPDSSELLAAAEELVKEGFTVLPYCLDDPILCTKLENLGCAAVMPLASPIGSGMGLLNPYNLSLIRKRIKIPIIIDAGIGTASDVAIAMELGMDAVLINTAIAQATDPVKMASAMKHAVIAGRLAYQAGRIPRKKYAQASSPLEEICTFPN